MKRIGIAAVLVGLAGCASTNTVLSEAPDQVFHTERSPSDVAFCLGNKNNIPVLEKADGSRVALIKNNYGGVSMAFSI